MDDFTAAHLATWIEKHVADTEVQRVTDTMLRFLHEYPDLAGARPWSDGSGHSLRCIEADERRAADEARAILAETEPREGCYGQTTMDVDVWPSYTRTNMGRARLGDPGCALAEALAAFVALEIS